MPTIRQEIINFLSTGEYEVRDISQKLRIPEKEVYTHLDHIVRSLAGRQKKLHVTPAYCISCGFVFAKRNRMKKPGRCPKCRSEYIQEPKFRVS